MPTVLFIPFFLTGMFIHQNLLGEMRGWSLEWLGACIAGYGAAKLLTNMYLINRNQCIHGVIL